MAFLQGLLDGRKQHPFRTEVPTAVIAVNPDRNGLLGGTTNVVGQIGFAREVGTGSDFEDA